MKKLAILLLLPIFVACSSDDNNEPKEQDYTSFVFYTAENVVFPNCVVASLDESGKYIRIAELGDLIQNKHSKEITLKETNSTSLYFFSDYRSPRRIDYEFTAKKNKKNIFEITATMKAIEVDKNDPKQYPQ